MGSSNSSISDEWINITTGKWSLGLISIMPLVKSIPINRLNGAEKIALQLHLRKSYREAIPSTTPAWLENLYEVPPQVDSKAVVKEEQQDVVIKQEDCLSDVDSGKGSGTGTILSLIASSSPAISEKSSMCNPIVLVSCCKLEQESLLKSTPSSLSTTTRRKAILATKSTTLKNKVSSESSNSKPDRKMKGQVLTQTRSSPLPAKNTANTKHCQKKQSLVRRRTTVNKNQASSAKAADKQGK